jgi:hypothetical protein
MTRAMLLIALMLAASPCNAQNSTGGSEYEGPLGVVPDEGLAQGQAGESSSPAQLGAARQLYTSPMLNLNQLPKEGNYCHTPAGRFGPQPTKPFGSQCSVETAYGVIWGGTGL